MPNTARAYQEDEQRASRSQRSDWNQRMNSSLNFMDDEYEEQRTNSVARPVAPVRPMNQTGSLRAVPNPAPRRQETVSLSPSISTGSSVINRASAASNALGQAKPIAFVAIAATIVLVAYLAVSTAAAFIGTKLDDMAYTETRTTNLEAYVGHNETPGSPTHFTAQNIRGQIAVIEYPGGDPSKAMVITGPYLFGKGEEKVPVTLNVADINGDSKPDLLITAKGAQTAYINDGDKFRAMQPEERTAIEKALAGANAQSTTK